MFLKFNRRGVRVGFALVGGVCVSLPLLKCSAVRAAAADLQEYTLSPQQALGLYGTSIPADYYNGTGTETVQFEYIGCTSDITALNGYPEGNGSKTYIDRYLINDWFGIMTQTRIGETPYLIYAWETDDIQSAASFDFSLRISHSVGITAYGYYTSVFWSRSLNAVYPGVNAGLSQYKSSYTLYGNSVEDILTEGGYFARPSVNSEYGIFRTMVRPVRLYNTQPDRQYFFGTPVSLSFIGQAAFAGSTQDGGSAITVGASEIKMKMERPFSVPMGYNQNTVEYYDYAPDAVYILVQCPTLWGEFTLPPFSSGGVDLSQIEDYLAQQSEDIANISEESTVQTRQLIAILQKLEQIYQKIPSVDLSVPALSTAPSIPIDSELDSRISADLESGAELLPDISESFDTEKMQSFSDLLTRARNWFPAEIITIGGLSLALAFVTWLLFRGRGS